MKRHFRFDLDDEREEDEEGGLAAALSQENQAWLAGVLGRLYERLLAAQYGDETVHREQTEATSQQDLATAALDRERSAEADTDRAFGPGSESASDFGSPSSFGADFNF